jgi:beta-glucanase (GH16 family)
MYKCLLVTLYLTTSLSLGSQNPSLVPVGQSGDWALIFSDDFDGQTLDMDSWTTCYWWKDHWKSNSDIWIDKVTLTSKSPTPQPTPEPTPTPESQDNFIQNGSFEGDISPWRLNVTSPASASVTRDTKSKVDGSASVRVDISKGSPNNWYVQFRQNDLELVEGETYQFSFWAKASENRQLQYVLQESSGSHALYADEIANLTRTWEEFTLSYTATAPHPEVFLGFNLAPATGCTNEANDELQWYQSDNLIVADGVLQIRAQEKTVFTLDAEGKGKTYDYTSGMISSGRETSDTTAPIGFSFQYGYIEIRAKVPKGRGLWSAFWLSPAIHNPKPEIDVLEILGHEPEVVHMSFHYSDQRSKETWSGPDYSADWHVFAVDWRPEEIVWYIDGVERWRYVESEHIPATPMYLLVNLAVGGWAGAPDDSTIFPSYYEIDYVRVWHRQVL